MIDPLRIGAIGCGYWGPNLIRNLADMPETSLDAVADLDETRLESIHLRHPHIGRRTTEYRDLFEMGLDAVVVSTPPETHHDIVSDALRAGLHVMVEKPMTTSVESAIDLVDLAADRHRTLMVGHTFEYNPAVRALKAMIDADELGEIRYIDTVRVGLGLFHPSLNVVWDLAPHDISILIYLLGEAPESVAARGTACLQEGIEDVAYLSLTFPSGVTAHTRMSWLDPRKTRTTTVVGSKKMVVYDDVEPHEKLRVYDKRVDAIRRTDTFGEFQFAYHYGSVVIPHIHFQEPLRVELDHFVESIRSATPPLSDGHSGTRVVSVIEAAQRSLALDGQVVTVDYLDAAQDRPRSESA